MQMFALKREESVTCDALQLDVRGSSFATRDTENNTFFEFDFKKLGAS